MLVEERGIAPNIFVVDKSGRNDGTFERADFTYDDDNDLYICLGGKELKQSRRACTNPRTPKIDKYGVLRYRARKADCDGCQLKSRCCPKEPSCRCHIPALGEHEIKSLSVLINGVVKVTPRPFSLIKVSSIHQDPAASSLEPVSRS